MYKVLSKEVKNVKFRESRRKTTHGNYEPAAKIFSSLPRPVERQTGPEASNKSRK